MAEPLTPTTLPTTLWLDWQTWATLATVLLASLYLLVSVVRWLRAHPHAAQACGGCSRANPNSDGTAVKVLPLVELQLGSPTTPPQPANTDRGSGQVLTNESPLGK